MVGVTFHHFARTSEISLSDLSAWTKGGHGRPVRRCSGANCWSFFTGAPALKLPRNSNVPVLPVKLCRQRLSFTRMASAAGRPPVLLRKWVRWCFARRQIHAEWYSIILLNQSTLLWCLKVWRDKRIWSAWYLRCNFHWPHPHYLQPLPQGMLPGADVQGIHLVEYWLNMVCVFVYQYGFIHGIM